MIFSDSQQLLLSLLMLCCGKCVMLKLQEAAEVALGHVSILFLKCMGLSCEADLAKIAAQEQTSGGMLHTLAQLHKVLQDVFGSSFLAADVAASNCAQQIPVEQTHSCMACERIWTGFDASGQVACTRWSQMSMMMWRTHMRGRT